MKHYLLPLLFIVGCATAGAAEPAPAPYRVSPGAVLLEDHFDQPALGKTWTVAKGAWTVIDGAIDGREKPEDNHPGVCSAKVALPETLVVTARLRFEGAAVSTMVFNGAGHICRVTVTPKGFTVLGEKDKKNEADKNVTLGKVDQAFARGQWYDFTIEITGDEMLVYTDAKHVAYGKDPKVGRAKTSFGLTVGKASVRYDNVVIRAAKPNPDWAKRKAELGLH